MRVFSLTRGFSGVAIKTRFYVGNLVSQGGGGYPWPGEDTAPGRTDVPVRAPDLIRLLQGSYEPRVESGCLGAGPGLRAAYLPDQKSR